MTFELLTAVYLAGVLIGLLVMRDPWLVRMGTALAWPLGILAFALVTVVLVLAAAYLWPLPVLAAVFVIAALCMAF